MMAQGDLDDRNAVQGASETLGADARAGGNGGPPAMPPELPKRRKEPEATSDAAPDPPGRRRALWGRLGNATYQMPSWVASMVVHMALLILLAWYTLPPAVADRMLNQLVATTAHKEMEQFDQDEPEPLEDIDLEPLPEDVIPVEDAVATSDPEMESVATAAEGLAIDLDPFGSDAGPKLDPLTVIGGGGGNGGALSGRGRRGQIAKNRGATRQSEQAVDAGLAWLAEHQFADGGWSYAHNLAPRCRNRCRNPSDPRFMEARNAATGMALLPFLGAGQTHLKGKYKKVVRAGLYFLLSRQNPQSGSLWEPGGRMYSHGLASIALCEAYAMTRDEHLHTPAQMAINFICYAQDPIGGGWRYNPQEPGDTSVLGWQLMALKSGHLAYLAVPPAVVKRASDFLDSVQSASGANYGYLRPSQGPSTEATTAIGLLCRMYLGWKKSNADLEHGVEWVSRRGPNRNLYYDYYATQVMHHWEGEQWKKWNAVMRDSLVDSQAQNGHEAGSWYLPGNRNNLLGGRLYCTAMATMILEVYYRHMPIYEKKSAHSGFPIE